MIYIIKFWRELIIVALVIVCGVLGLKLQTAQYNEKETKLIHEKLIAEANAKASKLIAETQAQRKSDLEKYANEINIINNRYNDALSKSNRVQQEIANYNTRLNTTNRETLENYAKTCGILYGKSTDLIIRMGQYLNQVDAELEKVTKAPQ